MIYYFLLFYVLYGAKLRELYTFQINASVLLLLFFIIILPPLEYLFLSRCFPTICSSITYSEENLDCGK